MPLAFVHLSDIHFQKKSGDTYDLDTDLRNELERDLEDMAKKIAPIAGILVTGDIAFSALEIEYTKARIWLVNLCRKIGCDESRVWVVPGNHDVDRNTVTKIKPLADIHKNIRIKSLSSFQRDKELQDTLQDKHYAEIIFSHMSEYILFASDYGCAISAERPYWENDFLVDNDLVLRLRGLTSTIISDSSDDESDNKVILGRFQAVLVKDPKVVYMTLCHHPTDWLLDKDEIEIDLNLRAAIQLFGHKHRQAIEYVYYNNANATLRLASGAIQPERDKPHWKPRYNIVALESSKTPPRLKIKLYPRVWNEDSKTFQPDPLCKDYDYIEYPPEGPQLDPTKNVLTVSDGDLNGQHPILKTNSQIVTIGRSPDNDIMLPEETVSREHGMILFRNEGYRYRHLSRTNHSRVVEDDGNFFLLQEAGEECTIRDNAQILIGPRKLLVHINIPANLSQTELMPPTENEHEDS
jgi:hypothetical protein